MSETKTLKLTADELQILIDSVLGLERERAENLNTATNDQFEVDENGERIPQTDEDKEDLAEWRWSHYQAREMLERLFDLKHGREVKC
jgi:uncharacterized protein with von Willebrand factor type A (vWA) domain